MLNRNFYTSQDQTSDSFCGHLWIIKYAFTKISPKDYFGVQRECHLKNPNQLHLPIPLNEERTSWVAPAGVRDPSRWIKITRVQPDVIHLHKVWKMKYLWTLSSIGGHHFQNVIIHMIFLIHSMWMNLTAVTVRLRLRSSGLSLWLYPVRPHPAVVTTLNKNINVQKHQNRYFVSGCDHRFKI